MTDQDEKLLLKDLCARLPYKLHCRVFKLNEDIKENDDILYGVIGDNVVTLKSDKDECLMYYQIKPYLRPISSMTEEEKDELWKSIDKDTDIIMENMDAPIISIHKGRVYRGKLTHYEREFLISHHFDYCGLIEKGLALEAPEGMYN